METLDNTAWDVLIIGTGLQQSLLALALSRSDKKILHIDENDYYGGAEAAFSLQEAEEWEKRLNNGEASAAFDQVTITKPELTGAENAQSKLGFSRAYSLALSPQIIYARSTLLQHLVSSRVYRQLEFLAVGSWWVYTDDNAGKAFDGDVLTKKLLRVPNGREDVFQDHQLDFKAKRALMKFLRFITDYEEQTEVWNDHRLQPFPDFLFAQFKIPALLQGPLLALALSPASSSQTTTEYALPRIARHLRSIGVFGAGFGAVIPKWGGLAEISQVSCRACAVGGGVYVLGKGLLSKPEIANTREGEVKLHLKDGEAVTAKWVVGGKASTLESDSYCRSATIVASSLAHLFPPIAEEAPAPASAVVVFPSGSLVLDGTYGELPPVHVFVHSSDTGECPSGQSILYASTSLSSDKGFMLLTKAVDALLAAVEVTPHPDVLWSVKYRQRASSGADILPDGKGRVLSFPPLSMDLAFDDAILDNIKGLWRKIVGEEGGDFLVFQDREHYDDDE
ncbi:rab protein geranylgeranyltransferase component a [Stagonosporopsis vannaccii]|nr:rab protein geranylgeranyltransferase component a [Stagonosporopsis vannaccii]